MHTDDPHRINFKKSGACGLWPVCAWFKSNDKLRVCGDFKVTINQCVETDISVAYHRRHICTLGRRQYLDLSHTYLQLPVDDETVKTYS